MSDKAVDDFSASIKTCFRLVCYKKNYKRLHSNLFLDGGILFFDDDSGNVTFSTDEMGNLSVGLNNIKLCYDNFDKGDQWSPVMFNDPWSPIMKKSKKKCDFSWKLWIYL